VPSADSRLRSPSRVPESSPRRGRTLNGQNAPRAFCIEVDDRGLIASVELGSREDVPTALLDVVSRMLSRSRRGCREFLWSSHPSVLYRIWVTGDDGEERSCIVTGEPLVDRPYDLTLRELDVLTLLALGHSNVSIATLLTLSPRTVTTHVEHVMRKMGVASRTEAAVIAVAEGLLRFPLSWAIHGGTPNLEASETRQDLFVTRGAGPVVRRKPLVIGAALPLTGSMAADGVEMANATLLAVDEINGRGGVHGRQVAVELVDVEIMDEGSIRRAFNDLLSRDVDVLSSGYLAHQQVAHEVVADSCLPYLHAATMSVLEERVRDDPSRYGGIFQVCPSDSNYAPRFVMMMNELFAGGDWVPSSRRITVIQCAWELSDLGIEEAARLADASGWCLDVVRLSGEGTDLWRRAAEGISRSEPAAVMLGHYMVEGTVAFCDRFLDSPSDTLIYSLYAPSVPRFRELLAGRADGILWATASGTYSDRIAWDFVSKYRSRFGQSPGRSHAGIAYDRVKVVAGAWATTDNPRDRAAVAAQLRQIALRGVNGVYYLGGPGQTTLTYPDPTVDPSLSQAHLLFQIQRGRQRILSPAPFADARFEAPPWLSRSRRART
jgi:branched-chain amino acid transport system substrate-binding protein